MNGSHGCRNSHHTRSILHPGIQLHRLERVSKIGLPCRHIPSPQDCPFFIPLPNYVQYYTTTRRAMMRTRRAIRKQNSSTKRFIAGFRRHVCVWDLLMRSTIVVNIQLKWALSDLKLSWLLLFRAGSKSAHFLFPKHQ